MESLSAFWTGLMSALPPGLVEAWMQLMLFAVPVCLYFAAAVLPFVVLFGLVRAHFGRRSLLERCSRQQARFGVFLNWLFVLCAAGVWFAKIVPFEDWQPLYRVGLYLAAGLLGAGTLLSTVTVAAWKPLRKVPVLHGILVFLSGICLAAIPAIGLLLGRALLGEAALPENADFSGVASLLLPSIADPFWAYAGLIHFLEIATAGALGLCWLLVRRGIDDFGRDYYVFAANRCGSWAAWGGWIAFLMAGVFCAMLRWQELLSFENPTILLFVGVQFAALAAASVLWTVVARSVTPMRHKIGMVMAVLFLLVAIGNSGVLVLL